MTRKSRRGLLTTIGYFGSSPLFEIAEGRKELCMPRYAGRWLTAGRNVPR